MATAMIAVVLFVSLRGLACMPEWCLNHLLNVLTLWEMKLSPFDSHGQPILDTWQGLCLIPTAPPDVPKSVRLAGRQFRVFVFASPGGDSRPACTFSQSALWQLDRCPLSPDPR